MQTALRSAASRLRQAGGLCAVRLLKQHEVCGIQLLNDVERETNDYARNQVPFVKRELSISLESYLDGSMRLHRPDQQSAD